MSKSDSVRFWPHRQDSDQHIVRWAIARSLTAAIYKDWRNTTLADSTLTIGVMVTFYGLIFSTVLGWSILNGTSRQLIRHMTAFSAIEFVQTFVVLLYVTPYILTLIVFCKTTLWAVSEIKGSV